MAPLHLLSHNDQNEVKQVSLPLWWHWDQCWYYMVPVALKMTSFHSLGQDILNEMQIGYVMPLALVAVTWCWWHHQWHHCIPYVKKIKMRYKLPFWSCAAIEIDISSMWCWWHCHWPLHMLGQDDWNEVQHDFFVIWYHLYWHQLNEWHQCIPYIKTIKMRCNISFWSCAPLALFLLLCDSDGTIIGMRWSRTFVGYVMSLVMALISYVANGVMNNAIALIR